MKKYILALDSGTSSVRAILFDKNGNLCFSAQKEITQYYPNPGWVEQDAEEIWNKQLSVCFEVLNKAFADATDIAAIGITNQRETTVVWNKNTGKPVTKAIVWQCRRTVPYCRELAEKQLTNEIRSRTGLVTDAYFSATKLKWILDNVPGAREDAENGKLLFGTVETWLIWNLTNGRVHVTDVSNASRTMMYNINTMQWDDELLTLFGVPKRMLPEVVPSSYIYGETTLFGAKIPVAGAAGDQQCALFGQRCFAEAEAKNTYGTGGFMLMNTGDKPVHTESGLISTVAWQIGSKVTYALEGSVFVAGAAIQWLRDELGIIEHASQSEEMADSVPDTNGCFFVPAFTGLGAPWWNPDARGMICGLTRGVNKNHIVRAALEAMAYQTSDLLSAMEEGSGTKLKILRTDGGASANGFLQQFQCDISNITVERPDCTETTALGAAFLAGLAVGFWNSTDEILSLHCPSKRFTPSMTLEKRCFLLGEWHKAVNRSMAEV